MAAPATIWGLELKFSRSGMMLAAELIGIIPPAGPLIVQEISPGGILSTFGCTVPIGKRLIFTSSLALSVVGNATVQTGVKTAECTLVGFLDLTNLSGTQSQWDCQGVIYKSPNGLIFPVMSYQSLILADKAGDVLQLQAPGKVLSVFSPDDYFGFLVMPNPGFDNGYLILSISGVKFNSTTMMGLVPNFMAVP